MPGPGPRADDADDSLSGTEWRHDSENDACQILPPLTVEERAAFGVAATAEHAADEPFTCRYEFWSFLRRPGGFHALINTGLDPWNLWKKLECPAPAAKTRALQVRPAALVSKAMPRFWRLKAEWRSRPGTSCARGRDTSSTSATRSMVPPVKAMPAMPRFWQLKAEWRRRLKAESAPVLTSRRRSRQRSRRRSRRRLRASSRRRSRRRSSSRASSRRRSRGRSRRRSRRRSRERSRQLVEAMLEAKAEARQFKGPVEGYVEATVEGSSVQKKESQEAKVIRRFWRLRATESYKMAAVRENRLGLSSFLAPAKRHRPGGPTEDDLRTEVGYYQRVTVETFVAEEAEHTSEEDRPRP